MRFSIQHSEEQNIYRVGRKNGANGATLFYGLYL